MLFAILMSVGVWCSQPEKPYEPVNAPQLSEFFAGESFTTASEANTFMSLLTEEQRHQAVLLTLRENGRRYVVVWRPYQWEGLPIPRPINVYQFKKWNAAVKTYRAMYDQHSPFGIDTEIVSVPWEKKDPNDLDDDGKRYLVVFESNWNCSGSSSVVGRTGRSRN